MEELKLLTTGELANQMGSERGDAADVAGEGCWAALHQGRQECQVPRR